VSNDYEGFESPEEQYYGTSPTLPVTYTGAWQTRQFGVGGATAMGQSPSIASALASPPSAMTAAVATSETNAINQYIATANDVFNYHAQA
jgi:hypothetical protein